MANWNGSYMGPEDPNYFLYSNQQQNSPVNNSNLVESWNFYSSNGNSNSSLQSNRNAPVVYEQNPSSYHQMMYPNLVSSVPPYFYQSPSDMASNQSSQHSRPVLRNDSSYNYEMMKQEHGFHAPESNSMESNDRLGYSNLHVTANEFVQSSNVSNPSGSSRENSSTIPNNVFFPDNNSQQEKQYYDQKRPNYKHDVNLRRGRFFKSNYRNYKSHSDKFYKPNTEESQIEAHATLPSTSSNTYESTLSRSNHSPKRNNYHQMNKTRKFERNSSNDSGHYKQNVVDSGYSKMMPKGVKNNVVRGDRNRTGNINRRNYYQDYTSYKSDYNREDKMEKSVDKEKDSQISKDENSENWRQKEEPSAGKENKRGQQSRKWALDDEASQKERLTELLNRGQLECLVCCDYIRQNNYVWSCLNCYHVLHLKCVQKWAKSSQDTNGWRCPACQNVSSKIPQEYYCFCGKTRTPEWNRRDIAHSCGEICGRARSKNNCQHKCTLLCHPGSCPVCTAMVEKKCGCGRTSQTVQCSTELLLYCDAICDKTLNCTKHKCTRKCHYGECGSCEETFVEACFCGKNVRTVECRATELVMYSCESVCDKPLDCGNHRCKAICHSGPCEPCALVPDKVKTCWCGQTPLTEERTSCLDSIPTCDKICSKRLKCGQPSNPHTCTAICHEGDCSDCDLTTEVRCRCNNMNREILCKDLTTKADDARCEKKCTKKRQCGKHKCNQFCCIEIDHICPLPCSKTLSCGRHKCELACHPGRCPPCWRSSFDELYCECGAAVIYPPVPCGTRKPVCDRPCSREHPCDHEVLHNCHSEPNCPPCTVLTQTWCYGKHELRKAVPCHIKEISCGLACNKSLSCGRHKCIMTCHSGPCERPGQQCVQPCTTPRELCGHICGAPCHEGKCPDTPCKEMVKVTCQCGHRSMTRVCAENAKEYQRIASSILASKMADMQLGHSIDLDEVFGQGAKKQHQLKTLECSDECKTIERNRRLALGLQIVNPDLSGKLVPRYSDYMKQWAKKDPHFCQMVHDKLTELVQLAKTSKQKLRSYSFECMNRDKRHFVHESCEHFGCKSQAYDQEPKRNIVATAVKDKCWLPGYSLLEIVQRENGQRKVPGPMLNTSKGNTSVKTILPLPSKWNQTSSDAPSTSKSSEGSIDYFNFQR